MQTLIYARFSSHLQNPRSIADQLVACRDRARAEGWNVVGEFSDAAISGAAGIENAQRPGLADLLTRLERGGVQQILTESTDRIARHQGDAFAVRERIEHAGARLFTLMDGVVDDITGTIKGLFDARTRKDLAARVRRGHKGNIRAGRATSGVAYGYRRVAQLDEKGELIRGLRAIDEDTAAIVRRVFEDYAGGQSGRQIATALNAEQVPAPRGGIWRASTLIGHRKTAFGILSNPVYVGQLVYGRSESATDPRTRRRSMRPGSHGTETGEAPHLRIVDQALWESVQDQMLERSSPNPERQRRPKHLLSGLGVCGVCGANWIVTRYNYFGCSARVGGHACSNTRLINQADYERRVLADLAAQMLAPDAEAAYLDEYRTEHARRAKDAGRSRATLERRHTEASRKFARLVEAIAQGGSEFPELRAALSAARTEREAITKELANLDALPTIALHPGLARQYRTAIADLATDLADDHARKEAAPKLRKLIARIVVMPKPDARRGVELHVIRHIDELLQLATTHRRTA